MTAAIHYHPEAYTTAGPKLMGRNAAGESFMRGFLTYSRVSEFWVQVQKLEHALVFERTVRALGRNETVKVVDKNTFGLLACPGVVYHPSPSIGKHAFQRSFFGHGSWSLCGITHTTASATAMDALTDLITAPVQPWDAVICTSVAVKNNVEVLLQAQVDYLKNRVGITKLALPKFPVIPLGINTQDFSFTKEQKVQARAKLAVDKQTLVVLFVGRLSFHAKAHPLAMYQALEAAAHATGKDVVLVECGWHANEFITKAFNDAVRLAAPRVRVITLDGRNIENRQTAWASADVFCSLSDNIQETFGITPVEAMAAGIPVVVSDWDGYKDTVRDGVDGFRIPTLMPGSGLGGDLALRHALEIDTYDLYCGHASSLVAVDVAATTQAFIRLFESPELRRQMGEAGEQRARQLYDWSNIIPKYEALWEQLSEIRQAEAPKLNVLPQPWPARMDPFHAFSNYPTQTLTRRTLVELVDADVETALQRTLAYRQLAMIDYAKVVLPSEAEIKVILQASAAGPKTALELVAGITKERQAFVLRGLTWLVKLGVLKPLGRDYACVSTVGH